MATTNNKDKRFYQLTLAIQKAINSIETPVKEKHVRSAIIGTFQEQCAVTYWMVAIRLPLQDNRIVAWKFCHVTHKLLREGHPACLDDSQRHIGMIENLGKLWVHLREGYGKLVHLYCNLLVSKLKFHARNPRFPGNLQLTADELDAIAENDVNNYFQLCVELFDYMDDILTLQEAVFDSLGNARANSMTASGQCRLAALIPCAQDASQIYDCNVRLLFRLHAALPADTLSGHRERFRLQFKKLSSFYKHASSLQYYRNLLTLPVLPSNPPNFLLQSDFGTYVTPVVSIPEPPPDEVDAVGALIDTSDIISQSSSGDQLDVMDTRTTPSPQPDPVVERDRLIEHLQHELRRMRNEVTQRVEERNNILGAMREQSSSLESKLHAVEAELAEERRSKEMLASQTPEIKQKLAETEEKAKVTDEKFQKLKGAYTQLREEHITLIRQKAEVDKLSANLRAAAAQHESAKAALQQQLNDRMKDVELLQQSASSNEEIDAYKSEISNLRVELEQSREKETDLETLRASLEALEIEHNTTKTEQEDKLNILANELKETKENLDKIALEKEERDNELKKVKEELTVLRESSGDEYKKVSEEKEAALKEIADLKLQHQQVKEEQMLSTNKYNSDIETLQAKLIGTETEYIKTKQELEFRNKEIENIITAKDTEITVIKNENGSLQNELKITEADYEKKIQDNILEIEKLKDELKKASNSILENDMDRSNLELKVEDEIQKIELLENELSGKNKTIKDLEVLIAENKLNSKNELEQLQNSKNIEISKLDDALCVTKVEKIELEIAIEKKNKEINESAIKTTNIELELNILKSKYDTMANDYTVEVTKLNENLDTVTKSKDEIIESLKSSVLEKDDQVIALEVEVAKLSQNVKLLEEELNETQAELEICKNELVNLKEEHEVAMEQNNSNINLKNEEFRNLNDQISKLVQENNELQISKEKDISSFILEKQVLEKNVKDVQDVIEQLRMDYQKAVDEKEAIENDTQSVIDSLKHDCVLLRAEIDKVTNALEDQKVASGIEMKQKNVLVSQAQMDIDELKSELQKLESSKLEQNEVMNNKILEKNIEIQSLEAKLEIADSRRLNSESELQDLLQQNTVLEADIATLKIQLEEAKKESEKQSSRILRCAGEAAVEVTQGALTVFESHEELSAVAAEQAAKALDDLAKLTQVKGNEESAARCAIFAAHNTAQLSARITELSNTSTDVEFADKLQSECKEMLASTKQCLESIKNGTVMSSACVEARGHVLIAGQTAATADRLNKGVQSVDDELAGMDKAIEEAVSQIENLVAASRAGDSGVKLEVNGKILDACTALMAAVKILVQDSRTLQNELGDTKTRDKMYRKNPQWSEGLISASKAVVFAAKLLVTSADEAVGAAGRLEGVSAAAHEVAGSTAQLVAASRARAPPASAALGALAAASRHVAAATAALVAAVRAAAAARRDHETLDTSALTLTATRRLEMESKVRSLELEAALDDERARLAALRKRHYQLAQQQENGNMTNGEE